MKIILFSSLVPVRKEAELIRSYLACGVERFHLKKPLLPENALVRLVELIGHEHREKLALHSHHHIARPLGIKRLHFSEVLRESTPVEEIENQKNQGFHLSTSVHSFDTLETLPPYFDYIFMGPVFPSISKKGYGEPFDPKKWEKVRDIDHNLIAIGGITNEKLPLVMEMGFSGAALLGGIWKSTQPKALEELNLALQFKESV
ncbi:thiamine phosphate synthase [Litoribacter alkaliphilus]|uniref:Thiamine phosphate synthase n=1 Tax=Litoribacter ruber TaxID=702568 RepID=A0AAP2G591_9BACT|nr:thiamine phosphate synthase [Litoribacter alkaliphilus]MBS9525290.1 thiamine phosphate synthase [Litoribacter alkaliphilus]